MTSLWKIRNRDALPAILLVFMLLVVSFGSRSHAFHQWICGEEIQCVLKNSTTCCEKTDSDHSSEEENSKLSDPLQPFCQAGVNIQLDPIKAFPAPTSTIGELRFFANLFTSNRPYSFSPGRAPPNLV